MANAGQRRKLSRELARLARVEQAPPHSSEAKVTPTPVVKLSMPRKILAFFEQPLFTLPVGIVGGIVGVLVYMPILALSGACILLAFHRAQVVSDERPRVQIAAWVSLVVIVIFAVYGVGTLIRRHLPHTLTAKEIVDEWAGRFGNKLNEPRIQHYATSARVPVVPLKLRLSTMSMEYRSDIRTVGGIKWQKNYADTRLYLINSGPSDYHNLSLTVNNGIGIFDMRVLAGCQDAEISPWRPQIFAGDNNKPPIKWTPGEATTMMSSTYGIRCGLIAPGETEFIMAFPKAAGQKALADIKGSYYDANGHRHEVDQRLTDKPIKLP